MARPTFTASPGSSFESARDPIRSSAWRMERGRTGRYLGGSRPGRSAPPRFPARDRALPSAATQLSGAGPAPCSPSPRASWRARRAPRPRGALPSLPDAAARSHRPRRIPHPRPNRTPHSALSPANALRRAASPSARGALPGPPHRDRRSHPPSSASSRRLLAQVRGREARATWAAARSAHPARGHRARPAGRRPLPVRGAPGRQNDGRQRSHQSAAAAPQGRGETGERNRTHATIRSAPHHLRTSIHGTARLQ